MSLFWRGKPVNHEPWDSRLHSSSNLQWFFFGFAVVCFPGKTRRGAFENQVWSVSYVWIIGPPPKKNTQEISGHWHMWLWGSTSSKHVHTVDTYLNVSNRWGLNIECWKTLFSGFLSTLMNRTAVVNSLKALKNSTSSIPGPPSLSHLCFLLLAFLSFSAQHALITCFF